MNLLRHGHDAWGERVVDGASWDLLPVAFWAGVAVIVAHLVWRAVKRRPGGGSEEPLMASDDATVLRHARIDRWFHWLMALTVAVLLATSLLPLVGLRFAWYGVHWMAGLLLTLVILLHIVRALIWQRPRSMVLTAADFRARGAGKYTLAQKLMHLAWAVAVLVVIVTGLLMMRKAGVPFMQRDPYAWSNRAWGVMTLLHDLAALLSVFLMLVHVYFAVLPEKRGYLRAMTGGAIRRSELAAEHDLERVARGE